MQERSLAPPAHNTMQRVSMTIAATFTVRENCDLRGNYDSARGSAQRNIPLDACSFRQVAHAPVPTITSVANPHHAHTIYTRVLAMGTRGNGWIMRNKGWQQIARTAWGRGSSLSLVFSVRLNTHLIGAGAAVADRSQLTTTVLYFTARTCAASSVER
jgi:hypothetical protein